MVIQSPARYGRRMICGWFPARLDSWFFSPFCGHARQGWCVRAEGPTGLTSPSMESLLGSSIRKETRWNYGNRLPANNKGCRVQCKFARRSHETDNRVGCDLCFVAGSFDSGAGSTSTAETRTRGEAARIFFGQMERKGEI